MVIVLGVLQYGLYFNDYLQARQAVRQGARTAVVQAFSPCAGATNNAQQIGCYTKSVTAPVSGTTAVRVSLPGATASESGWKTGKPLLVCEVVKTANVSGMLPMPNNGYVLAKTQMAIEQDTAAPSGVPATGNLAAADAGDADPTGANWSWCT
jgi:hypothetical protein